MKKIICCLLLLYSTNLFAQKISDKAYLLDSTVLEKIDFHDVLLLDSVLKKINTTNTTLQTEKDNLYKTAIDNLNKKQQQALAQQQQQKTNLGMIGATIIALLICLFSMFTYYRLKLMKHQKNKLDDTCLKLDEAYLKLEEITNNELAESNLKALKSQLNPHFIFNLLNSIQALVLKGEVDSSYKYMTKFASLVRKTLHFSDADLVNIEEEIELLKLYLDLEKLRFSKNFEFQIITNQVVDIKIPPLLIQPFIENALVHGLLHKKGKKTIKIEFEKKDKLICTITDNGIGRAESKAIKKRQNASHQSFSNLAIKKRFELISNTYQGDFGFIYKDIFLGDEFAATQVKLFIPFKEVFLNKRIAV